MIYEAFEKVNPAHPDKVADRIAGALVDLAYKKQRDPKIAVEVLLGHGTCNLILESSVDITAAEAAEIVKRIANIDNINFSIVPQDEHLAENQAVSMLTGDNGIFLGVPQTDIEKKLCRFARDVYSKIPSDGKYILERTNDTYEAFICQSNLHNETNDSSEEIGLELYRLGAYPLINPLGFWTGGSDVDSGATNRKLGSDMGRSATGGGLHGKDLSKADVSVNIYCWLKAQKECMPVYADCIIGSENVHVVYGEISEYVSYKKIVEEARHYINIIGGFEKFAEWGLLR